MNKQKYELRKPGWIDRLLGVVGLCGNCGREVFNVNSEWARNGLCVHCYEFYTGLNKNDSRANNKRRV